MRFINSYFALSDKECLVVIFVILFIDFIVREVVHHSLSPVGILLLLLSGNNIKEDDLSVSSNIIKIYHPK